MLTAMQTPAPPQRDDPADWAATVAVVLSVSLGLYGYAYTGWLGVFVAGTAGIFISVLGELNADQPVTNDYDAARAINTHARSMRLRESAAVSERLADAESQADLTRMMLAFRTIFLAEAVLGAYMFARFQV